MQFFCMLLGEATLFFKPFRLTFSLLLPAAHFARNDSIELVLYRARPMAITYLFHAYS